MITSLKRSKDRKTANLANNAGTQPLIANAFGLPAGRAYSCPGATSVCESVCYAGKLERVFPSMRALLEHNWQQLVNASQPVMEHLLVEMIHDFVNDCNKRGAAKAFRIHWDGDFFSRTYALAWANTVMLFPDVQFWVYTRSFTPGNNVIDLIADIPNLSVYLSVDNDNSEWASHIIDEYPSIMVAALSDTMGEAGEVIRSIRGDNKPGAKCPELIKSIPLIDTKGGACFVCQLCPKGKADIRFASTAKGRN